MKKFLKTLFEAFMEARAQVILQRKNRPYL